MMYTKVEHTTRNDEQSIPAPRISTKPANPPDPEISEAWYAIFLAGLLIGVMVLGGFWIWWNAVYGA
jgi:hypothetical protein